MNIFGKLWENCENFTVSGWSCKACVASGEWIWITPKNQQCQFPLNFVALSSFLLGYFVGIRFHTNNIPFSVLIWALSGNQKRLWMAKTLNKRKEKQLFVLYCLIRSHICVEFKDLCIGSVCVVFDFGFGILFAMSGYLLLFYFSFTVLSLLSN